ncbi:hypothetical protein VNO77_25143 [Canavalia gladiata]|uniref:Uncharacterized protein n=1 Tax=Canavalia gladiata TaxID=3824 RepID=A0AAN9LA36_CANGL
MSKQIERGKESKVRRYIKASLRFLTRVRDIYVEGMIQCSGHFAYAEAALGCPTGQLSTLPRSFSVNSATSDDDFKDLVRAASLRSYGNRVEFGDAVIKMPRSRSVGIGKIDENKPCDYFEDDALIKVKPNIYRRSRSYAPRRGGAGLF